MSSSGGDGDDGNGGDGYLCVHVSNTVCLLNTSLTVGTGRIIADSVVSKCRYVRSLSSYYWSVLGSLSLLWTRIAAKDCDKKKRVMFKSILSFSTATNNDQNKHNYLKL